MTFPPQGIGISGLSQLAIDVDKDWQGKGITNIKELVSAMQKGDMLLRSDNFIVKISAGSIGTHLKSQGPLALPIWSV